MITSQYNTHPHDLLNVRIQRLSLPFIYYNNENRLVKKKTLFFSRPCVKFILIFKNRYSMDHKTLTYCFGTPNSIRYNPSKMNKMV